MIVQAPCPTATKVAASRGVASPPGNPIRQPTANHKSDDRDAPASGEPSSGRRGNHGQDRIESNHPPSRGRRRPEVTGLQVLRPANRLFEHRQAGVADRTAESRDGREDAAEDQNAETGEQRDRHRQPDHRVQNQRDRRHQLEPVHHQRQGDQPDQRGDETQLSQPPQHGASRPPRPRTRLGNQPPQGIFIPSPGQQRTETSDGRHGQKRQLRADLKHHRGIPAQQEQRRRSQRVVDRAAAAGQPGNAKSNHQNRRPRHRRTRLGQHGVGNHKHGRNDQGPAPLDRQQTQQPPQSAGQNPDMQSRNGQQMDGSGQEEVFRPVARQLVASAQQHRRRQIGLRFLNVPFQLVLAETADAVQPPPPAPAGGLLDRRHTIRPAAVQFKQLALSTSKAGEIEFPGIPRPGGPADQRHDLQPVARRESVQDAVHQQTGAPRRSPPLLTVAHPRDLQRHLRALLRRNRGKHVGRRWRNPARTGQRDRFHAHRPRPIPGGAAQVVVGEQIPVTMVVRATNRRGGQQQQHDRPALPTAAPSQIPAQQQHGRQRCPKGQRPIQIAIQQNAACDSRQQDHQRLRNETIGAGRVRRDRSSPVHRRWMSSILRAARSVVQIFIFDGERTRVAASDVFRRKNEYLRD
jgi:hypothetical protein